MELPNIKRSSYINFYLDIVGRDGFIIYCDASHVGLSCVLMQHGKFIAYVARKLKVHEQNYPTHDFELTTVVFTLIIWCHYLYRVIVNIFIDHESLQYAFSQRDLNLRQKRQLKLLKVYDMSVYIIRARLMLWPMHLVRCT